MGILIKGITGFDADSEITEVQVKTFLRGIIHPFVADFKGIVAPHSSSNYWRVPVKDVVKNKNHDLLIHSSVWYLAIVTPASSWMSLEFLDFPQDLSNQIKRISKTALLIQKQDLDRKIEPSDLDQLNEFEVTQIKRWKSKTIGEIMFNGYD